MISRDLFMKQDKAFKDTLLPPGVRTITAEVGISYGWEGFASSENDMIAIDEFGISGPYKEVGPHFGFSVENLVKKIG